MKTTKKCKTCKVEFKPFNSLQKYCSLKCRYADNQVLNVPKRKAKISTYYKPIPELERNKKLLRFQLIKEKGKLFCQKCNSDHPKFGWHVHHIVFRSEKPGHKNLHDLINLIHLCSECHYWFHEVKGRRIYLVEARQLNLVFGNDVLKAA